TFATEDEAISVVRQLLEDRLIACANVMPSVTSLYHWDGDIQQESEVVLVAKTTAHQQQSAITRLAQLHRYDTPCILSYSASSGFVPYMEWVSGEVKQNRGQ